MFSICRNVSLARCASVEHLHLLSPTLTRFDGGRVQRWPVFMRRPSFLRGHQIKMKIKLKIKVETKKKEFIPKKETSTKEATTTNHIQQLRC
jgi:hypothetical protein